MCGKYLFVFRFANISLNVNIAELQIVQQLVEKIGKALYSGCCRLFVCHAGNSYDVTLAFEDAQGDW